MLSAHLFAGQTRLHVLADAAPGPGFAPAAPGLEDVYFSALSPPAAVDRAPAGEHLACGARSNAEEHLAC
ncbi:MAG: hypothetical protein MUF34_24510 [Polyangiaceae bacterium]|nr:hypothetical protein [Polyangiaceae bacterium]